MRRRHKGSIFLSELWNENTLNDMRDSSKIFSALFWLAGLGILIAIFFLFLKDCQEEKLFYLNMTAACLVFSMVFIRTFDIFCSVPHVAQSGSGYGLKWYGIWFYTPLATALVVCSIIFEWKFDFCLIGHLVFLFILLLFFFSGYVVKKNVNEVMDKIEIRKSGLKEIDHQIALLEMQCKTGSGTEYLDAVDALRENVRFITASDNRTAVMLEEKLISTIRLIASQVEHSSQPAEVINKELKDCLSIIELRKNQY